MKQTVELDIGDFECPLCQLLIYEPVTTSCGHTYCKSCIIRSLDHNNKCPICRNVIHISPDYSVNIMLQTIIEKAWPEQYRERKQEAQKQINEQEFNLPLFIMDVVLFPKMKLPLHVFEPRYRLMLRRCLEGGRRFGVVPVIGTEIAKIGTTAVIDHHVRLADGRSLISTSGGRRFKLAESWDQDGYKVGKVQYLDPEEEEITRSPPQMAAEASMFKEAKELVNAKIGPAMEDIREKFGDMPLDDPSTFSFWLASLLPISVEIKQKLLEMNSTNDRLQEEIKILSDSS